MVDRTKSSNISDRYHNKTSAQYFLTKDASQEKVITLTYPTRLAYFDITKQIDAEAAKLLMEDPTIYEYDAVYDEMKADKNKKAEARLAEQNQKKAQSKYVRNIMNTVQRRERQYEVSHERMLQKKLKKDSTGEEEMFLTSSYLKKKQMMKEEEQRAAREEKYDQEHSINNKNSKGYSTAALLMNQFRSDTVTSYPPHKSKGPERSVERFPDKKQEHRRSYHEDKQDRRHASRAQKPSDKVTNDKGQNKDSREFNVKDSRDACDIRRQDKPKTEQVKKPKFYSEKAHQEKMNALKSGSTTKPQQ